MRRKVYPNLKWRGHLLLGFLPAAWADPIVSGELRLARAGRLAEEGGRPIQFDRVCGARREDHLVATRLV